MIHEYSDEISFKILSSKKSYVNDFHLHNFFELFLLLEGDIDFCVQRTFYHLTPGSLMLLNDLEVHKSINKIETPYKRIYIHIPPSFFQKYSAPDLDLSACFTARNIGEGNLIQLTDTQCSYFKEQFARIMENETSGQPGKELLLDTYLLQLLVFINNVFLQSSSRKIRTYTPTVQRITNYMETHLAEPVSLDSLARIFSHSKYHLCHTFKEETGTTIYNYLLLLRIARAKALLGKGKSVSEVCELSGFTNYSNFITTFKKHTGYTPGKYAALTGKRQEPPSTPS